VLPNLSTIFILLGLRVYTNYFTDSALASSMEKSSFKADFTKELALSISESSISLSTLVTF
ncbi:hypothetical protein P4H28_03525, partial [Paenibacillus larvae]|uniref:hypothetical protein n=1 Tax=Paenibacillus larvae TaxID=1464 RepID=UPI002DBC630A